MRLSTAVVTLLASTAANVYGGQIPVFNDVPGGKPTEKDITLASEAATTSAATTPGKLRIVENSGVCETTPGVYQASGYGDLTANESMWFWFFEARKSPDTAPLTIWLNGGPGSSSMIGLFQEHGPCRINNDSMDVTLNPNSWNEVSNMLYIDQPIGAGFSYGSTTVSTSQEAASDVWKFLQIFFSDSRFEKFEKNDFAIWTESYGGHYGPAFAAYFLAQNVAVADGTVSGVPINLKFLGIGDGITVIQPVVCVTNRTDLLASVGSALAIPGISDLRSFKSVSQPVQEEALILTMPRYHPLVPPSALDAAQNNWNRSGGCRELITDCYNVGSAENCTNAQDVCNSEILDPLAGNYDVYYVLVENPDPYPPDITSYLTNATFMEKIGAESEWAPGSGQIYVNFHATGDWMRNSRPDLETVINAGVRTIVYDGDADYIVNFNGVEAMVNALQTKFSEKYALKMFANYAVDGQVTGIFKNAGTFSYIRIFGAGHEVPRTATHVLAGQVPVVNGVHGGKPIPHARTPVSRAVQTTAATTPGKLRVVENSGVCETTPGVYQASGYGDLTTNESVWFWFFEARQNPDTAPLTVWINGGPGSSSMIGLFQEHGPCRINNDSMDVTLNPNSWNEVSNMLYIDQPVGVGFSHGVETVGTSLEAAMDMWKFLQIFFSHSRFEKYQDNDFALWTESYGGHYGPTFAAYFLEQNAGIANGTVSGMPINLKVLGIGDGITDPLSQYPGYLTYAASNPYHPLVNASVIETAQNNWNMTGGCKDQITSCYNNGTDQVCASAEEYCNYYILDALAGDYDVYYVLSETPDPYPPDLTSYLTNSSLMAKIGAESEWQETSFDVYLNFEGTGDWMRNSRPYLETVIDAGVRTIIYDGDADYILNFNGVENMVNALQTKFSEEYAQREFANYTVEGQAAGIFKNAGTFSYVRIFGAYVDRPPFCPLSLMRFRSGHEVPAYKYGTLSTGQAALQFFSQIMSNNSLFST
ncbi:Carboxypeptidase S1 [Grifola frondosa]|uniref:Carboxypeptidase n=1 Tax=Grifola frondosa TaxID=5627 RepID=A0A1C7MKP0_GRIFR|nr:Carboxypeptidase S1 [Grifola frondosa]